MISGIITDDPVGAAGLPHWSGPDGRFDELVLDLGQLRTNREPIATRLLDC